MQQVIEQPTSRAALWFGMLGGAVAWLLHLMLSYVISEFGCASRFREAHLLGITATEWLLIGVSVLMAAQAAAAALTSYRAERELLTCRGQQTEEGGEAGSAEADFARTGRIASSLFLFIILGESLPILFFLRGC